MRGKRKQGILDTGSWMLDAGLRFANQEAQMDEREQVYLAALAGLLHDVGKFAQRTSEERQKHSDVGEKLVTPNSGLLAHLIPLQWEDDIGDVVKFHHGGDDHKELVRRVRLADWLAASERQTAIQGQGEAAHTPLIPITAEVTLGSKSTNYNALQWGYLLPASEADVPFPQKRAQLSPEDYAKLWDEWFTPRIQEFPGPVDSYSRLAGLLDVLAETLSYIPSATPWEKNEEERTTPDVPLYHHLQLTAALAVCLGGLSHDEVAALYQAGLKQQLDKEPKDVARLVKVDFSGIQDFIYRITTPQNERRFRKSAKRLRGRSLHVALLNRALGDWLLQTLKLPPTQLIYAGGGVLELLLPPDAPTEQRLEDAMKAMRDGLWQQFGGALGVVYADILLRPADFANMQAARERLEDVLAQRKAHKWEGQPELFQSHEIYHTCPVCGLSPTASEEQLCPDCEAHEKIGSELPYAEVLLATPYANDKMPRVQITLPRPMQGTLALTREKEWPGALGLISEAWVRGINAFPKVSSPIDWLASSAPGRWTLANIAPLRGKEICDFEEIAALSGGSPYLGVLKADADHMGVIFSGGLHPNTFSRSVALSHTISRFFGEYLNTLAREVTAEWRARLTSDQKETITRRLQRLDAEREEDEEAKTTPLQLENLESVFYVLYAGGDDLFVLGPWDALIDFAFTLRRQYRAYTCENPFFGLSAGLVLVKPHFPIQQFARLADEAEREAKSAGRDRLTLFGKALPWAEAERLIVTAQGWAKWVVEGKMPRGLLHDLGRSSQTAAEHPAFTPTVYYALTRRLHNWELQDVQSLGQWVLQNLPHLTITVKYTSLITRKE